MHLIPPYANTFPLAETLLPTVTTLYFIKYVHQENTSKNFRLFPSEKYVDIENFKIPNNTEDDSGLTILVGENGCGKWTILDALTLPYVSICVHFYDINRIQK